MINTKINIHIVNIKLYIRIHTLRYITYNLHVIEFQKSPYAENPILENRLKHLNAFIDFNRNPRF